MFFDYNFLSKQQINNKLKLLKTLTIFDKKKEFVKYPITAKKYPHIDALSYIIV